MAACAIERPSSATHGFVALSGLLSFLLCTLVLRLYKPFDNITLAALCVMAGTAIGIFLPDIFWQKIHRRNIGRARTGDIKRSLVKYVGLLGAMGFVALLYWIFPEYSDPDPFYAHYWLMLRLIFPFWLMLSFPYIYAVDRRMEQPHDALWQMGRFMLLQWRKLPWPVVGQFLAGWIVKGFFLPLMFTYFCNDLQRMLNYNFSGDINFKILYDFIYDLCYFVDVGLISMTYLLTLRLTDTQIRSTEPSIFGWVVALVCYQPFWSTIGAQYFNYGRGPEWGFWFSQAPAGYILWGSFILFFTVVYAWATVSFGGRFSNLTHRGIITNGPYRFTKHPAYIAKNISWWLISMPFMIDASVSQTIKCSLALLMLNGIYFLRAKTEERHLSLDPVYRQYAAWIDENGLLRFVNRIPVIGSLARWRPCFGKKPPDGNCS